MSLENEDNSSRVLKHVNPHVKKKHLCNTETC